MGAGCECAGRRDPATTLADLERHRRSNRFHEVQKVVSALGWALKHLEVSRESMEGNWLDDVESVVVDSDESPFIVDMHNIRAASVILRKHLAELAELSSVLRQEVAV